MSAGFDYYRSAPASHTALSAAAPLSMPVLAIAGDHGVGAALGEALAKHCSDLATEVIAGCGHYLAEEKPAELSALLIAFVRGEGA